ncbi:MAG: hypothetical protein Q9173_003557 [Seirophora scorigena]
MYARKVICGWDNWLKDVLEPPIGELRFRAPLPPQTVNRSVDQGLIGRVCPQARPAWQSIAAQFAPAYLAGQRFNSSAAEASIAAAAGAPRSTYERTTEDCLFLDVVVPEQVFSRGNHSSRPGKGAPVLVWIYGGGYTFSDKTGDGAGRFFNPAGLIQASRNDGSEGVVYVAFNYRLGAFGWLAGPTLQSQGTANVGLYDQRLALQWVQRYIHLFGGDPNRLPSNFQQETTFNAFLSLLNVSTLQEARQLPSSALIEANVRQVGASPYGLFTYGPVVDGLIAPGIPGSK